MTDPLPPITQLGMASSLTTKFLSDGLRDRRPPSTLTVTTAAPPPNLPTQPLKLPDSYLMSSVLVLISCKGAALLPPDL